MKEKVLKILKIKIGVPAKIGGAVEHLYIMDPKGGVWNIEEATPVEEKKLAIYKLEAESEMARSHFIDNG